MLPARRRHEASDVILFFNSMFGELWLPPTPAGWAVSTDLRRFQEARAVVFHLPSLGDIGRLRKPPGQLWIAWWMESEERYPRVADPDLLSRFDLTMSYRRDSDLFLSYFHYRGHDEGERELRSEPQPKHGLAVLLMSNTIESSGRTAYAAELMRHLPVTSYGSVLRNQRLPEDRGLETKLDTIARFKFTLAFENAIAPDYVTEKLYDPLVVGSVPVYLGAPNVNRLVPAADSFIDVTDFSGPRALADHLLELDRDESAYQRHLAWKEKPFQPEFQEIVELQRKNVLVRLCELVGPEPAD
jgi:hypothetical protein